MEWCRGESPLKWKKYEPLSREREIGEGLNQKHLGASSHDKILSLAETLHHQ